MLTVQICLVRGRVRPRGDDVAGDAVAADRRRRRCARKGRGLVPEIPPPASRERGASLTLMPPALVTSAVTAGSKSLVDSEPGRGTRVAVEVPSS